ncbi:hypothetical protein [Promicromonospora sukumoe]|uniref:hypothetical protein n=1 Tax=Promicromonospora sukumoe TaxID=88382 RepID=UPI00068607B3|nr:hypothetical protein [Promicromonospora sukumoe]
MTREPPGWWTPAEPWSRGRWSLERRGDEIADVRYDGVLVLRSVRLVVRDDAWRTADVVVDQVRDDADGFLVDVRATAGGVDVRGTIRVVAAGPRLTVEWDGAPARDLLTNRTGLVVLHPPHVAGAALAVTHPDATVTRTRFPRAISPHQPARDIAALAWHDGGLGLRLDLRGDVFEMEDQRNWTDASFKTYSRPLTLPFPYLVRAGESLRQAVEVTASGRAVPGVREREDDGPAVVRLRAAGTFPSVTTSVAASVATTTGPARGVPCAGVALLVELDLGTATWPSVLARAAAPGLPLDVRLVLPDDGLPDDAVTPAAAAALTRAAAALSPLRVARVAAFSPTTHVAGTAEVAALRAALATTETSAEVLGGVRAHFTELNRNHDLVLADVDGLTFSLTPLFHSGDTEQLVESVAMQRLVAAQSVDLAAGRPVHVGPVTLRPRFNDVAEPHQDRRADPAHDADPRQSREELAAWVVASASALAVPGVASIAWFEDQGPRGLVGPAGVPRPVAEPVRALAGLAGRELLSGASPDGRVWALGAREDTGTQVLAANLDRRSRTITVELETERDGPDDSGATQPHRLDLRLAPQTWTSVWA